MRLFPTSLARPILCTRSIICISTGEKMGILVHGNRKKRLLMIGFSDLKSALGQVLWADSELCGLEVEYGDLCLIVRESTGGLKRVICEGSIGYELAGFWDEIVIASVEVMNEGAFLDLCLLNLKRRLGGAAPPSGSEARNREKTWQLVLIFDDANQLNVAMKGLRVEVVR